MSDISIERGLILPHGMTIRTQCTHTQINKSECAAFGRHKSEDLAPLGNRRVIADKFWNMSQITCLCRLTRDLVRLRATSGIAYIVEISKELTAKITYFLFLSFSVSKIQTLSNDYWTIHLVYIYLKVKINHEYINVKLNLWAISSLGRDELFAETLPNDVILTNLYKEASKLRHGRFLSKEDLKSLSGFSLR